MDRTGTAVRSLAAPDTRETSQIGHHARLELRFAVRRGRTELVHAYAEPPLRIGRTFAEGDGVHMILASVAPGIFGGDFFEQQITVESGGSVRLTSQSALQAHAATTGDTARIVSRYSIERGASLSCVWDPLIPFPNARLSQTIAIDLAEDAALVWSDAFMAGREARGERWLFAHYAYELALRQAGRLSYLERYALVPAGRSAASRWAGSDASYFGSVIATGTTAARDTEAIQSDINAEPSVSGGVDRLEEGLALVRLASPSGVAFHRARRQACAAFS